MQGTYEDLSMLKLNSEEISSTNDLLQPSSDATTVKQLQGQPLLPKHEKEQEESPFEEYQLPTKNAEPPGYDDIINQTFTILPLVRNIDNFLLTPPQHNMQTANYLDIISTNTGAACSLEGRNITIIGTVEAVQLAYEKLLVIQKTYVSISSTDKFYFPLSFGDL